MILDTSALTFTFFKLLDESKVTPSEIAPLVGVHMSTIYVLHNGRLPISRRVYILVRVCSKFLSWAIATKQLPFPKDVGQRKQALNKLFESWFCKE